MRPSLRLLGAVLIGAGCGGSATADCIIPPCAPPIAINAKVVDKASGASLKAHVDVTGALQTSFDCDGACIVPGSSTSGVYHIAISAAGYAATTTDVTITTHQPANGCGCVTVDTQSLTFSLTKV